MKGLAAGALRLARSPLGPLFDLEVRSAGRRRTTYLVRSGYVALLLLVTAIALAGMLSEAEHAGPAARLQALAGVAPTLTVVIGWLQFIVLTQMAPALTAASICNEKQQRTLPALATTPLSAGQIVLGKLAGRLVQALILALASLPALLAMRWLGGLTAEPVIAVTALTLTSVLFSGSLGMLLALQCKRARTAAGLAMGLVMLLYLSPLLMIGLGVQIFGFQPSGTWLVYASRIDPAIAMGVVTATTLNPSLGVGATAAWVYPSLAALGAAAACCALTAAGLRRTMREEVGGAPKRGRAARREAARQSKPRHSRVVGERVVLWRERRAAKLLRSRSARLSAVVVALALAMLYAFGSTDSGEFHLSLTLMVSLASLLAASQATVASVAGERESRTWDALIATPLSARAILFQKFRGALWRVAIGPAILAVHFAIFGALGFVHPLAALHVPMILLGYGVMLAGTGVLLSLMLKKSAVAGALHVGLALGIWVGLPLLTVFTLGVVLRVEEDFAESVATVGALAHPVFLIVNGALFGAANASDGSGFGPSVSPGAYGEIALLESLTAIEFTAIYAMSSLGAALVGVGAVALAARWFPRRSGRA